MSGRETVVAPGFFAAPHVLARCRTFRNWFQPRYQYVYAKFRCVA